MPGAESCLERHEWYKHGTCSGISADAYFALSNGLVASFAQTEFNQYIASQIGRDVARNDLLDRFEAEFGAGSWVIPSFPAIHRANSHQQRPF
jgi:ribonuclease I